MIPWWLPSDLSWFGCQSVKILFLLPKETFFKYCKKWLNNMLVPSFVRWRPSCHHTVLAIALLQIKVKPCSKHRALNRLFTFFITSLTSCFFLTKIDNIVLLLTPYDLHFSQCLHSLSKILNVLFDLVKLINIGWANKDNYRTGCSSTNVGVT